MKNSAENNFIKAALLLICFWTNGCQKATYYTGDLGKDQLAGVWVLSSSPKDSLPPVPPKICEVTLAKDGTFEATNFPLVMDFYPSLKVKYVTERGTWSLEDRGREGNRSRWNLNLVFSQSRSGTEIELTGSARSLELFQRTDLDVWIGYTFALHTSVK